MIEGMAPMRRLLLAVSGISIAVVSCTAPESGGIPRGETPAPLTSLLPAPAPTTATTTTTSSTTTTTIGVPPPPDTATGTVCDLYDGRVTEAGTIQNEAIVEASGIAASRVESGAYWIVNDSGNASVVYAVDERGDELAAISVRGVLGFDWEDIAVGPGPEPGVSYLYIGDIGDNLRLRSTISLVRFPEPNLTDPPRVIVDVETLRLEFPEGAEDAEAMWVDPITADVFVVSKRQSNGKAVVYRAAAADLDPAQPVAMSVVAELRFGEGIYVTAADVSSDGAVLALRGYNEVWVWVRTDLNYEETLLADPCMGPSPDEVQGESIAFVDGGLAYVTLSEGSAKPLNIVELADP